MSTNTVGFVEIVAQFGVSGSQKRGYDVSTVGIQELPMDNNGTVGLRTWRDVGEEVQTEQNPKRLIALVKELSEALRGQRLLMRQIAGKLLTLVSTEWIAWAYARQGALEHLAGLLRKLGTRALR